MTMVTFITRNDYVVPSLPTHGLLGSQDCVLDIGPPPTSGLVTSAPWRHAECRQLRWRLSPSPSPGARQVFPLGLTWDSFRPSRIHAFFHTQISVDAISLSPRTKQAVEGEDKTAPSCPTCNGLGETGEKPPTFPLKVMFLSDA